MVQHACMFFAQRILNGGMRQANEFLANMETGKHFSIACKQVEAHIMWSMASTGKWKVLAPKSIPFHDQIFRTIEKVNISLEIPTSAIRKSAFTIHNIVANHDSLLGVHDANICYAVIFVACKREKIKFTIKKFAEICCISTATLSKVSKLIITASKSP
jgi:transcription initiation factor TFIIIB Brf1 subunit/transcription initiation factor TFIIB